jgi:hypothetical protein
MKIDDTIQPRVCLVLVRVLQPFRNVLENFGFAFVRIVEPRRVDKVNVVAIEMESIAGNVRST